jgi:uncharacterized damage-inducible protein DinB
MDTSFAEHYLDEMRRELRKLKAGAERALAQVSDEELLATLDSEANSIAVLMKHMAGNMLSRWTDFLTTDGEKPDRNRDGEFVVDSGTGRADLLAFWEAGWSRLLASVDALTPEDLGRTVAIRAEPHTVPQALNRSLIHYAYHAGQIVLLAKHWRGEAWQTLSVPRGKSEEFNRVKMAPAEAAGARSNQP